MMERGCFLVLVLAAAVYGGELEQLMHLPEEHIAYFFTNNPHVKDLCAKNASCPYKHVLTTRKCWGYEEECPRLQRMRQPSCPESPEGWAVTEEQLQDLFWTQADFGYVRDRQSQIETICEPRAPNPASLHCSPSARFCRGKNIYIDFATSNIQDSIQNYREDMLSDGQLGAYCTYNKPALQRDPRHTNPLWSWYGEMQHFVGLDFDPFEENKCDVTIDEPTYIIKIDSGLNMYHHFCDFVNLYITQHVNNSFSRDVHILVWDTTSVKLLDTFDDTFRVFSNHPLLRILDYDKKKLCLRDAVFSLLPRSEHFYNMRLIPGCEGSSLYRAFSQHVLHGLGVTQEGPRKDKVRVTFLSRVENYRNILNQNELVEALMSEEDFEFTVVEYKPREMAFVEQLQTTHNSEVFIGMHGAGLTHALFLPDWAVLLELYDCGDTCYRDLARLRGVKYVTWQNMDLLQQEDEGNHPRKGAHKKYTNYSFDAHEFVRLVRQAAGHVTNHAAFIAARQAKYGADDRARIQADDRARIPAEDRARIREEL